MGEMAEVPEEIAAALARGATVLTGRQRAARSLRQAVDRSNRASGVGSWAPARVLAWDAWTSGLWHRVLLAGGAEQMLLNRTQERALWTGVIEGDGHLSTLRSSAALAGLAAEAWGGLSRYQGVGRLRGSAANYDSEAFARWAVTFAERCGERGYLTQGRLEGMLLEVWGKVPSLRPEAGEILLVGFERLVPAQVALLKDLRRVGWTVGDEEPGQVTESRRLVVAADEAEEVRAAAEWARGILEERPSARVGVLVPGLKDASLVRAKIERSFREVLASSAQAITVSGRAIPYEFSVGQTLNRTEMGAVAVDVLTWTQEPMELSRVSSLLLSPLFAGRGEGSARAEFDAYELRRKTTLRPEVSLDWLIKRVERSERAGRLAQLAACLRRMQVVVGRSFGTAEQRSYGEWAEAMREMLSAAGWGAGGAVGSVEFQTRERWESAVDELTTLDFEGGRVTGARAVAALRGIVEGTTFAPESNEAPVQVMGPEEAAGLRFDAVWFLRAGERSWPAAVAGSPLLAWGLRRELGMPGSDGREDAGRAARVTQRIAGSCGEIVFSYARQTPEGRQRASAVLGGLGMVERDAVVEARDGGPVLEVEVVDDVVRLPALPDRSLKGGVGVLKAQAACAFHAFAEYRLFATELETRDPGMNASERGTAVHTMLERFWAEVQTQGALKKMGAAEREGLLRLATDAALAKLEEGNGTPWDKAYLEAQRRRLLRLGGMWLEVEAERAVPFTVERRESEERDVAVGPLRLSVRLDRVDATEQGAVLIDYKTGAINSSVWQGERPDEPQIPLYAALAGGLQLYAVAFGMVRPGKDMKLSGYADDPTMFKRGQVGIEMATLEEQVERWRGVLEELANGFARGDTRVSPKIYPGTCQFCAHRLICRLDVPSLHASEDEEEGEDERG